MDNLSYNKEELLYDGKDYIEDLLLTRQCKTLQMLAEQDKDGKPFKVDVDDLSNRIVGSVNYTHHILKVLNKANLIAIDEIIDAQTYLINVTDKGRQIAANAERVV